MAEDKAEPQLPTGEAGELELGLPTEAEDEPELELHTGAEDEAEVDSHTRADSLADEAVVEAVGRRLEAGDELAHVDGGGGEHLAVISAEDASAQLLLPSGSCRPLKCAHQFVHQ